MASTPRIPKDLGRKVQEWDELDASLKAFAHMAVAAKTGCSFCLDFAYFQAHNEGLDETKASEVPSWRESTVFTPLESALPLARPSAVHATTT